MKAWRDEDLILHLYGEHPRREALARDVASDPELARRFARLAADLAPLDLVEPPEPPPGFESLLWARLRPRLAENRSRRWSDRFALPPPWRLAALAATLVAALGLAFWAGRASREPAGDDLEVVAEAAARGRILDAALAAHLERSGLLLTDLANAPAGGEVDEERAWAARLLASNRLYRRAAVRAGERRVVALLDELEPLLLELAHSPPAGRLDDLQQRLAARDLLFKVRVVGGRLSPARSSAPLPPHDSDLQFKEPT